MNTKNSNVLDYINNLYNSFSEVISQVIKSRDNPYEIAGLIKKETREKDILVYRVTATDKFIDKFTIFEIYQDDSILLNFSKEEIKYISSLAILLASKKEHKYKIVWENFRDNLGEGIIKIKDRDKPGFIKANINEIEKNISLIDDMSGIDGFNLGKKVAKNEILLEENYFKNIKRFTKK